MVCLLFTEEKTFKQNHTKQGESPIFLNNKKATNFGAIPGPTLSLIQTAVKKKLPKKQANFSWHPSWRNKLQAWSMYYLKYRFTVEYKYLIESSVLFICYL